MKIDNLTGVSGVSSVKPQRNFGVKEQKSETSGSQASSEVSFSQALSVAQSSPDVDMSKVERLRRQIESGEYKPNPEKIADKMILETKAFLTAKKN